MKKLLFISLAVIYSGAVAQSDLTFYHMGAVTPQSSMMNASFFPDAEAYFSLPVVSGSFLNANLGSTYNDFMSPVDGTDSVKVDLEGFLASVEDGDNLSFRGDLSLFQFGLMAGGMHFSLFSNLRYQGGMRYPVEFLNYFVYGNGNFVGQEVEETNLSGGAIAYHEIGLGYSQSLTILEDKLLTVGGRVKLLTGLAYASASEDASVSLFTDPDDFSITATFNDATFRTVGFNDLSGDDVASYIVSNSNKGFAVDLGAQLQVNEKLGFHLALNDIGSINWKQDVENYTLVNSQISLDGFDNLDDIDLAQALEDSIDVWSERTTTNESFSTAIGMRTMAGATYQVLPSGTVYGSLYRNGSAFGKAEVGFGAGYTHQVGRTLTVSTTILKEQSRPVEMGAGLMVRAGLLQLYGVFDDAFNLVKDPADVQSTSFRLGLNFMIGRKDTGAKALREKREKDELSPFPPEYDLDHLETEEDDGINGEGGF